MSFKAFSICGISLIIHWSWLLFFFVVLIFSGYQGLIFLPVFLFVTLHEYGHCFAAKYVGYSVKEIILIPLGGIALIDSSLGNNPKKDLFVIFCGPMVNIFLSLFFGLLLFTLPLEEESWLYSTLVFSVAVNLVLAIFNLLPIYPLDGGRIFHSLLQIFIQNRLLATKIAVRSGQVFAVGMIVLGCVWQQPMLILIFLFSILMAQQELKQAEFFDRLKNIRSKIATALGDPSLENAPFPVVVEALEAARKNDKSAFLLDVDELIPLMKSIDNTAEGRSGCFTTI